MAEAPRKPYGFETIVDLAECDTSTFTRASLEAYFDALCNAIDMELVEIHIWDEGREEETEAHLKGISAVCFIATSSVTIHALDLLSEVYINIFSCKPYEWSIAADLTRSWFKAKRAQVRNIARGPA